MSIPRNPIDMCVLSLVMDDVKIASWMDCWTRTDEHHHLYWCSGWLSSYLGAQFQEAHTNAAVLLSGHLI